MTRRPLPVATAAGVAATRQRAEQGDAKAQADLGVMYATGEGVPRDLVEAVAWYRQAADQGWAEAQNALGSMYATGRGGCRTAGPSELGLTTWHSRPETMGRVRVRHVC